MGHVCSEAGLFLKDLIDPLATLSVGKQFLINGLIYEIEKYRRVSGYGWKDARQWMVRINSSYDTSSSLASLTSSWNLIYDKVTSMKKKHQTVNLNSFMNKLYNTPTSREMHVVKQLAKSTVTEQRAVIETYHHLMEI